MGKPAFRIIQTHFAADNNVGDVAAKEEVRRQAEMRLATVPTWRRPHTLRRCQLCHRGRRCARRHAPFWNSTSSTKGEVPAGLQKSKQVDAVAGVRGGRTAAGRGSLMTIAVSELWELVSTPLITTRPAFHCRCARRGRSCWDRAQLKSESFRRSDSVFQHAFCPSSAGVGGGRAAAGPGREHHRAQGHRGASAAVNTASGSPATERIQEPHSVEFDGSSQHP